MAYYTKNDAYGATVTVTVYDGSNIEDIALVIGADKIQYHLGYLYVLNTAGVGFLVNIGDGVAIDDGNFSSVIPSTTLINDQFRINVTVWDPTNETNIDDVVANVGSVHVSFIDEVLRVNDVVVDTGDGVYMSAGPKKITAADLAANYTVES